MLQETLKVSFKDDKLDKLFEKMMSSDLDNEHPASYILIGRDPRGALKHLEECFNFVCHAKLAWVAPNLYDEVITRTGPITPENERYLSSLLVGPYKDWQHLIELQPGYAHIRRLDLMPANVLYNFCIASRVAVEFPDWFKTFDEADPLKSYVEGVVANKFPFYVNSNHLWFGNGTGKSMPADVQAPNVLAGKMNPNKLSAPYKSSPSACTPCNIIWDN